MASSASASAEKPPPSGTTNGTKQSSLFSTQLKPKNPAPKRPHMMFDDSDDEEEQEGQAIEISMFGDTPAERKEVARTIAPLADTRTWGGRVKRQKSNTPQEVAGPDHEEPASAAVKEDAPKFGLHVPAARDATAALGTAAAPLSDSHENRGRDGMAPELNEDEEAVAHLLGHARPVQRAVISEEDAFRRDADSAPSDPTLEDYKATPVEGFGAALMRGYLPPGETLESWKEKSAAKRRTGAGSNRIDKDGNMKVERRGELLGLGAKELELGVNGGGKKKQSRKQAMEYEPLARRNMKTGEIIGEKDFQKLVEKESSEQSGHGRENGDGIRDSRRRLENGDRSRRDRNDDYDDSDGAHRRHRNRERNGHDEHRDRDRDRDRDRERHRRPRDAYDDRQSSRRYRDDERDDRHRSSRRHRDRSREYEYRGRR